MLQVKTIELFPKNVYNKNTIMKNKNKTNTSL